MLLLLISVTVLQVFRVSTRSVYSGCCVLTDVARKSDRTFEAVLYTSDSEQIMRYTDEVRGGFTPCLSDLAADNQHDAGRLQ